MMNRDFEMVATRHNEAQKRGVLNVWTVYEHPKDFPHSFVARRFEITKGGAVATEDIVQGELSIIRQSFQRCGLICLSPDASDEAQIVESWI